MEGGGRQLDFGLCRRVGFVGPRMIVFNWLDYACYFELALDIEEILYPPGDAESKDMTPGKDGDAP